MKLAPRALAVLAAILITAGASAMTATAAPVGATVPAANPGVAATPRCNTDITIRWDQYTAFKVPITSGTFSNRNCVMGPGARGAHVRALQDGLRHCLRVNPGPSDGIYGARTRDAVLYVQRRAGIAADGIYGPRTEDFMLFPDFASNGGVSGCYR